MKISVAICTWNRSRLLRRTLEQLQQLNLEDRFSWELVVVNNASTDDTADVIDSFASSLPLKSVFEPNQGLSHSRNRAVAEANGDYVVWTDDDVLVCQDWLFAYYEAFEAEPNVAFFGGCIEPEFESPCPDWLEQTWAKCRPVYACRMLGDEPIDLNEKRLPYGANYALRMDVQRDNLYDTELGRKAGALLGEEETHLLAAIARNGGKGRWVPKAKLKHIIPDDRVSEKYIQRYFVGRGQTNVTYNKQTRGRIGSWIASCFHSACYRIKRRYEQPEVWVSHMINASIFWGECITPRKKINTTTQNNPGTDV